MAELNIMGNSRLLVFQVKGSHDKAIYDSNNSLRPNDAYMRK